MLDAPPEELDPPVVVPLVVLLADPEEVPLPVLPAVASTGVFAPPQAARMSVTDNAAERLMTDMRNPVANESPYDWGRTARSIHGFRAVNERMHLGGRDGPR